MSYSISHSSSLYSSPFLGSSGANANANADAKAKANANAVTMPVELDIITSSEVGAPFSVESTTSSEQSTRTLKPAPDSPGSCRSSAPASAVRTKRNGTHRTSTPLAQTKRAATSKPKKAIAIDSCRLNVQRAAIAKLLSTKQASIKQCLVHVGFDEAQASNRTMQMRVRRQVQKMVQDLEAEGNSGQPSYTAKMLAELQQTPVGADAQQPAKSSSSTTTSMPRAPKTPFPYNHIQFHSRKSTEDDISILSSDIPQEHVAPTLWSENMMSCTSSQQSICAPSHTLSIHEASAFKLLSNRKTAQPSPEPLQFGTQEVKTPVFNPSSWRSSQESAPTLGTGFSDLFNSGTFFESKASHGGTNDIESALIFNRDSMSPFELQNHLPTDDDFDMGFVGITFDDEAGSNCYSQ